MKTMFDQMEQMALVTSKHFIPAELMAYLMEFLPFKPSLRLVSKAFKVAFDENKDFVIDSSAGYESDSDSDDGKRIEEDPEVTIYDNVALTYTNDQNPIYLGTFKDQIQNVKQNHKIWSMFGGIDGQRYSTMYKYNGEKVETEKRNINDSFGFTYYHNTVDSEGMEVEIRHLDESVVFALTSLVPRGKTRSGKKFR